MAIPGPGQDVLPGPDADFGIFGTSFDGNWVPATYNTVLPTNATITAVTAAFAGALLLSNDPPTRTAVTINDKNIARAAAAVEMRSAIRAAVAAFRAGIVNSAQLSALQVRTPDLTPTPFSAFPFGPLLAFVLASPGVIELRLTQVDAMGVGVSTRKFPIGQRYVEVQESVAGGPGYVGFGNFRRVVILGASSGVPGDIVTFRARYMTSTGLGSPWSSTTAGVVA